MTIKDYIAIGISSCALVVSIIVLLWGNNLLGRLNSKVDMVQEKANNIENELKEIVANASSAPTTEKEVGVIESNNDGQQIDINAFNITLSDFSEQEGQVKESLSNPYSGYPALVRALQKAMGNHRLPGNATPLTIINAKNLKAHGRSTSQPIIDTSEIEISKLQLAIYSSWKEKNSGSTLNSFEQIIH